MDDNEFDQVPQNLFQDVTSVKYIRFVEALIPVSNDTRAIVCGADSTKVAIVAVRVGNGRCLVLGNKEYPAFFLANDSQDQCFIENCRQWLSQGKDAQFESIDQTESMDSVKEKGTILVWNGHNFKSDAFMNDLRTFLEGGGALVCGVAPWNWLYFNKDKSLLDFTTGRFCDSIGIKVTGNLAGCDDPIPFKPDLIKFKNVSNVVQALANEPNNGEYLAIIGSTIKELGDTLPDLSIETLQSMVLNAGNDVIPTKASPIKDKSLRQQSMGLCGILCGLSDTKAPGIKEFPGDFDDSPSIETDVTVNIQSKAANEWYCTGYYVPAGTTIQIVISEQTGVSGWSARIGCHSDDLASCNELRRWHCISICKPLSGTTVQMSSAFGGLLFLESSTGESNSISVRLQNVVLTPTYDLMDSDRVERWEDLRVRAQGLWTDIAGQYIVFNLPSQSVRHLDSAELDRALRFYDSVVVAHHELRGTTPGRRERIVSDEQPSAGYMHSGYPVVTHLDVIDPKADYFLLNNDYLEKDGYWGIFHELGHNMQRYWWTFSFAGEVTVNIFSLHAMDVICKIQSWIHPWLTDKIENAKQSIQKGTPFDEWKASAGVGLFIYAQLAREFGWDSYKAIFRQYEETKPNLNSDQEKIDHWITTFSRQVGFNLVPLFKFWDFPVSQSTIDGLGSLPIRQISDELIQVAPERYHV
ncbi:unnamed protein product [Rotaria sordida]|uniref:Peptidase M60 domain-containing protein n=2 Tax=Rotaria sordida TaxID=392033 RepID=A0A813T3J6_9BILA|nr:unnamed protein product [Rotaria sordida]